MTASNQDPALRLRTWYLVHVLASLTLLLVLFLIAVQIYHAATDQFPQLHMSVLSVIGVCAFALLWFWVRMVSDFFGERPRTHAAGWGWFLFLGFYFGALAYFWVVWRPRHRLT